MAIDNTYVAYCFDTAVARFGMALTDALKGVEGKNKKEIEAKSERVLSKWLDLPARYRDPVRSGRAPAPK